VKRPLAWPVAASLAAVILTPILEVTIHEAMGLLLILVMIVVLWALTRLTRREMGLAWGRPSHYALAILHPIVAMGVLVVAAWAMKHVDVSNASFGETARQWLIMTGSTLGGVLLTEEGFFRGWLWGSLERARQRPVRVLLWTTTVFTLWHIPAATLEPSFRLPAAIVPVYLCNVVCLGLIWGMMRLMSGSIVITSISHALWNGFAYVLFGYSHKTGDLGIDAYNVFGPERGFAGLLINAVTVVLLWRFAVARNASGASAAER
jgi:membrane protease YdiL (CAAX protease family)